MNQISVIIPTKNRIDLLKKVLPTYISQDLLGEVIIINDGSTDSTSDYLNSARKKNKKLVYFENKNSMGAPYCRNIGVKRAKYQYIYFGEDDLYLKPGTLKLLLSHLQQSNADVIAGRRISLLANESERDSIRRVDNDQSPIINRLLITTNCQVRTPEDVSSDLLDASMLIKKKIIQKIPYEARYKRNAYREETDFQISCREAKYRLIYCPHVCTFHLPKKSKTGGNHGANAISYEIEVIKNDYFFFKKHRAYLEKNFHFNFFIHLICFIAYRIFYRNAYPLLKNIILST